MATKCKWRSHEIKALDFTVIIHDRCLNAEDVTQQIIYTQTPKGTLTPVDYLSSAGIWEDIANKTSSNCQNFEPVQHMCYILFFQPYKEFVLCCSCAYALCTLNVALNSIL